jgi:hypothetical protein
MKEFDRCALGGISGPDVALLKPAGGAPLRRKEILQRAIL